MIDVCCAIIRNDEDKILIVQRSNTSEHPNKWEFPGGKINKNESAEDCIIREIQEELSMNMIIVKKIKPVEHNYGYKQIRLIPFICDTLDDSPILIEHISYAWLDANDLATIDFTKADIPVAMQYIDEFGTNKHETKKKSNLSNKDKTGIKEMLSGKSGFDSIDLLSGLAHEDDNIVLLLFEYSLRYEKTLAFRASYVLVKAEENAPGLLENYYSKMIKALPKLDNESVIRSFLKILTLRKIETIDENCYGLLTDTCFKYLNNCKTAIAVKAYSMELLYNITTLYPELSLELSATISRNMEGGSAGIIARGRYLLKKISHLG